MTTLSRQLTSVDDTRTGTLATNFQNTQFGPTLFDLGNGRSVQTWYDTMGRFYQQVVCGTATKNNCYYTEIYGEYAAMKGSRATNSCDTVMSECFTYGYDDLNRLSSAAGNTHSLTFGYDRYGNRVSQNVLAGSAPAPTFTFNTANNQITTSGFSYDAAGNMTNNGSHSYTYDADGNVLQVDGGTTASYTYDALNQRVQAVENGTNTLYAYNINGQRVASYDGSGNPLTNQVYSGSTPVAFYQGGAIHYQHQDWLGTERVRTNASGSIEGTYQSLPFGDGFAASGSDNDQNHYAMLDRDADDTHHATFRQYSSTQGRWMSPDPYDGSYNVSDPQSFNRYVYVRNNPLAMVDPSGQVDCAGGASVNTAADWEYCMDNNWSCGHDECFATPSCPDGTIPDQNGNCYTNNNGAIQDLGPGQSVGAVSDTCIMTDPICQFAFQQYMNGGGVGGSGGGGGTSAPSNQKKLGYWSKVACNLSAEKSILQKDGVGLALDGAGFIPFEKVPLAIATTLGGIASFFNSAFHADGKGMVGGAASEGIGLTYGMALATGAGGAWAKAIPYVGTGVNTLATVHDLSSAYSDGSQAYSACVAKHW